MPVLAMSAFWDAFFILLIWIPLIMVWAFALVDIFRRDDIHGLAKALWIVCVVLLPFFGTLIYLIARPTGATREEREFVERSVPADPATQLETLAALHDRGKLTDGEFEAEKARILAAGGGAPAAG
jgi:hypothetical protein